MARHTCPTTNLLKNDVSLEMVKEFLEHKNINSTMIYARVTKFSKIRSMERLLKVLPSIKNDYKKKWNNLKNLKKLFIYRKKLLMNRQLLDVVLLI